MMDEKEMYNQTRSNILAMMDVAMGGRAAEEVIYGMDKVTTGKAKVSIDKENTFEVI